MLSLLLGMIISFVLICLGWGLARAVRPSLEERELEADRLLHKEDPALATELGYVHPAESQRRWQSEFNKRLEAQGGIQQRQQSYIRRMQSDVAFRVQQSYAQQLREAQDIQQQALQLEQQAWRAEFDRLCPPLTPLIPPPPPKEPF